MRTIYSLVTKPINQNVAIIRVSGPDTFLCLQKLIPSLKKEKNIFFEKLTNDGNFIDDILVLSFVAPNSFTGADLVEIQCHGSIFVVRKIITQLSLLNIEQAKEGEFTKQAFENGKIDLIQAQGINSLILSDSELLANEATKAIDGVQTKSIIETKEVLEDIVAIIQVAIDYPENTDLPKYSTETILKKINALEVKISKLINNSKKLVSISDGIKVVIVGRPNAGKSTLLNAILNKERAIVSQEAGTTRDVVRESIYLNGIKVSFSDTAGIRETQNKIENQGIKKTKEEIDSSDIVIGLINSEENIDEQIEEMKMYDPIFVLNKKDLNDKPFKGIKISSLKNEITNLIDEIIEKLPFVDNKKDEPLLITQSQIDSFSLIYSNIESAINLIEVTGQVDVALFEFELALKEIGKLIGIVVDHNYFVNLFSGFCIGK